MQVNDSFPTSYNMNKKEKLELADEFGLASFEFSSTFDARQTLLF